MLDWDKNKTVNISTVSETFGIPASALRYWESMGLITLGRRDNNYREYSYSSLLNLSDICYLRNLGIPVKAIKEYQTLSLADSNALYLNKKSELEAQISSLQSTYSMLRKTLSLMNELEYIQKHPYTEAQPDIPLILSHSKLYDKEVWKKYFSGQYQFAGVRLGPPNCEWVWGWAAESRKPDEELAWTFAEGDRHFVQFILRIDVKDRKHTNLDEAINYLKARGYNIGEIIVRYITIACEGQTRWDYYKAWIEII